MTTITPPEVEQREGRRWVTRLRPAEWTAVMAVAFEDRVHRLRREDRGDVPGWVLVTLMTAGLVTVIWALAKDQLGSLFSNAIKNVKP